MRYTYRMRGTCASQVSFDLENGKVYNVEFLGGCNGNLKAISKLCEGADAETVAKLLEGNTCGYKSTSCADQFSKALTAAIAEAVSEEAKKENGETDNG